MAEVVFPQAEADYCLLMEGVTDYAILILDPEGCVVGWNAGAQHLFGYQEKEIRGEHLRLLFFRPEEQQGGVAEQELKTAAALGRVVGERWYVRKDGLALWCAGTTTALRDRKGYLRGFGKILRDCTRQPQATESAGFARDVQDLVVVLHGRSEFLLGKLGLARQVDDSQVNGFSKAAPDRPGNGPPFPVNGDGGAESFPHPAPPGAGHEQFPAASAGVGGQEEAGRQDAGLDNRHGDDGHEDG